MDEDAPNYRAIIQNPMDIATLLQRVDCGKYITCKAFLEDFDLILINAKRYNGDDYNGARIVSRACELRDAAHGMLSQMDPALVSFCEKIAAEGGPVSIPDDLGGSALPQTPVCQMATVTRASARLRNVQPEVNLDQSYEALKRPKKNIDAAHTASTAEDGSQPQEMLPLNSSEEPEAENTDQQKPESSLTDCVQLGTSDETSGCGSQDVTMSTGEISSNVEFIKQLFVERTKDYGISQLERLYTRVMKGVLETSSSEIGDLKPSILRFLLKFAEDEAKFCI
ncbi:unnamed protein product [Ilex paraguariensis]|uniref:Bromo domain-containing protein n=1 Tax=Ilex paraguariensis TaxID=185542 RepID=A0ABC8SW42_9AQUA